VLDAWLHDLRVGWGERAARSAAAITPVIAGGLIGDLHTIGFHFATDGHPLNDVLAWFRLLAARSRPVRHQLERGGIIHLASGWADGLLHEDAETVAPFEVLRLRLRQQVQTACTLGHLPGTHLALVVIETDGSPESTARAAHHAREAFSTGETMAATPTGKLLILARRDQDVRSRTRRLTDAMLNDVQLSGAPIRVWIEPLAMSADHVDSHLLGLAS
jgi:hypothetical protein